jgi:hypothetical protein
MPEPTGAEILALPMPENDANAPTVGGYLTALLREVWTEQDGFSGKRPFGNSGWDADLMLPLVTAGLITGEVDEEGYLEEYDSTRGHALILRAIDALGGE